MKKLLLLLGSVIFMSGCSAVNLEPNQTTSTQVSMITTTTVKQDSIRGQEKGITNQVYIDAKDDLEYNDAVKNFGLDIVYGDVTGDGQEEALVSIPSDGAAGVTAVLVYGLEANKLKLLQRIDGYKMVVQLKNGSLQVYESNPENPDSSNISLMIYGWNGKIFVLKSIKAVSSLPVK